MEFTGFSPPKYARMTTACRLVMKDWAYSYAQGTMPVRLVAARGDGGRPFRSCSR